MPKALAGAPESESTQSRDKGQQGGEALGVQKRPVIRCAYRGLSAGPVTGAYTLNKNQPQTSSKSFVSKFSLDILALQSHRPRPTSLQGT